MSAGFGLPMRTFDLFRHDDVTGVSGEGVVAQGCTFHDSTVAMRWCVPGKPISTTIYNSILDVVAIHGHDGRTEVRWHERGPQERNLG